MKLVRFTAILAIMAVTSVCGWAQSPENVLVVINAASPASVEIGSYYAQKRQIPAQNVIRLQMPVSESVERTDFERQIEAPLAVWFTRNFAHDRILYIVLTKGVPLRINGTSGQEGTVASVDSELTLLYRKLSGVSVPPAGRTNNPYFLGSASIAERAAFTHEKYDIFLVSRLDGYSVADVRGLIDRGGSPAREGSIVLDDRGGTAENTWLKSAAETLRSSGHPVVHDATPAVLKDVKNVLGYYSWGSNDPAIRERQFNLSFMPGALAAMFVNTDARTMNEPPADWRIGAAEDATTHFAGSPQSLTADLIRAGVTGAAGHVAEPYLDATIRPNILFPAYLAGANLIEAFYSAMPFLSWQTIVVGDPLSAPFRKEVLSQAQISSMDSTTEFPAFFSARRLQTMESSPATAGVAQDVLKLLLFADARSTRQDREAVVKALEEATAREGRLAGAHLNLAMLYEQNAEYDKAIDRYRRVLETSPNNPIVLNNLAYGLAVRKGAFQEALPLAEKAYAASNRNPSIADTLAWISHLSGDDRRARDLLAEAVQAAPQNAAIRLHHAVVLAALNEDQSAQAELARALELDPKLASNPEVERLRSRLLPK